MNRDGAEVLGAPTLRDVSEVPEGAADLVFVCTPNQANEELLAACIALGGSITGEHGTGMDKAGNLPLQYADADLNFMFRLRRVFDPDGVMNPGNGKVHRDCAVRCISGGAPPAFIVKDASGDAQVLLLTGSDGRAVNREVLDYVAEPLTITGRLARRGDALLLRAEPGSFRRE